MSAAAPYELLVAPIAFGLAALHAWRALGPARAVRELLSLVLFGFALEWSAMRVFASHDYRGAWLVAPLGVPVAVALVWAALILCVLAVAARLGHATPAARAAAAAVLGIALDLLMEPVAVRSGLWRWTPPGSWLGVPIGNFVGWAVLVGGWVAGAERWSGSRGRGGALSRVVLAAGVVLALLGVGAAWRALGAERLFEGAAAWLFCGVLFALAAIATLKRRATTTPPQSLGSRLAAAPGPLPSIGVGVLLAAFAWNGLRLGGALALVAAGSALALAPALHAARRADGTEG